MKDAKFYECECSAHLLEHQYDEEDSHHYISFWTHGVQGERISFWRRLKAAWNLIIGRDVDSFWGVILSRDNAQALAQSILKDNNAELLEKQRKDDKAWVDQREAMFNAWKEKEERKKNSTEESLKCMEDYHDPEERTNWIPKLDQDK